ncbi:MAG TPA: CDP-glucose 4,6-dehydratase [Smithellaceae bacterium]|nr:CDP-glucose 4,6-dehydratase [Smithellaceae bacterium]
MAVVFNDIYKGMNVMVTGAYGFKGTWLSFWLERLGANVTRYGHAPRLMALNHHSLLGGALVRGSDMLDYAMLEDAITTCRPEIIFHLAAKALVIEGFQAPGKTFENNIMAAVNLMDICKKQPFIKGIVLITTDKVYEDKNWIWGYRENDTLGGSDPYSASKVAVEHAAACYRKNFFPMIAVARAGNVIGGGDWSDYRLIPDMVKAAAVGHEVEINTPNATRPWQHVLEPLSGYLMLGMKLLEGDEQYAREWNFGPTGEMTVLQVLEMAQQSWNKIQYRVNEIERHKGMVNLLKIDSTLAHSELGWRNRWDQKLAIEKTIEWYRDYYTKGLVNTPDDIDQYEFMMKVGYAL